MDGNLGSLAAGVIWQAWADAGAGIVRGTRRADTEKDRHEAARFLTAEHGPWALARKSWAELAGICPNQLRERALTELSPKEALPPSVEIVLLPRRTPKPGTKLAAVVELLGNPNGITIEEMQERFGWSRVTCSTVLSGDLPSKFGVRGKRGPDDRYRLVEAA